jgi:hypothetical protein
MRNDRKISRRTVISSMAAASTLAGSGNTAEANHVDGELLALGQQLETLREALDHASDHDAAMAILDGVDSVSTAIVLAPAQTLQGLYIKARATAWSLEHDCGLLDPTKEATLNDRVAASIIRDLLRLREGYSLEGSHGRISGSSYR